MTGVQTCALPIYHADDNQNFIKTLKEKFSSNVVNFVGITQILPFKYGNQPTIKDIVDDAIKDSSLDKEYFRTVEISSEGGANSNGPSLSEEERNKKIMQAIKTLLGNPSAITQN